MLPLRRALAALSLVGLLGFGSSAPAAVGPADRGKDVRMVWQRVYGDPGFNYQVKAIAGLGGGEQDLVLGADRGLTGTTDLGASGVVLWWVERQGGKVDRAVVLQRPDAKLTGSSSGPSLTGLSALLNRPEGELVALVSSDEGPPGLLGLRAGAQSSWSPVTGLGAHPELGGAAAVGSEELLVWGHRDVAGLAAAIGWRGKTRWAAERRLGKHTLTVDGTRLGGGAELLVANAGDYDFLYRGPSKIVLTKVDREGHASAEVSFPGRYGSVAAGADGGVVLVYDQRSDDGQSIVAAGFDGDLAKRWETPVLSTAEGYSNFRIAPLAGGGFAIAGAKDDKPYVVGLDEGGGRSWEFWGDTLDPSDDYFLYVAGRSLFLASTIFAPQSDGNLLPRVRLIKLALPPKAAAGANE